MTKNQIGFTSSLSNYLVADGLTIYLDATNPLSYNNTNIWYDLTNNGYDATLYNGFTFSNDNGGVVLFDGGGASFNPSIATRGEINIDLSGSDCTIIYGSRYMQNTPGFIPSGRSLGGKNLNWLLGTWANNTGVFYTPATDFLLPPSSTDLDWHIYTGVMGSYKGLWDNDTKLVGTTSVPLPTGPNGIVLGSDGIYGESANCQISFLLVYNRILTDSEILRNFNYFKNRLNL